MNLVVASVLIHNSDRVSPDGPQRLVASCDELGLVGQVKYFKNHYVVVLEGGIEALDIFKPQMSRYVGEGDFYVHLDVAGRSVDSVGFQFSELQLHDPKWLNNEALDCFVRLYLASIQWPQLNHLIDMLCLVFASEYVEDYLYPPTSLAEAYSATKSTLHTQVS